MAALQPHLDRACVSPLPLEDGPEFGTEESGELVLRTLVDVGYEQVMQTEYHWRSEERSAPVGSIQAERMLEEGVTELAEKLKEGVDAFVRHAVGEEETPTGNS